MNPSTVFQSNPFNDFLFNDNFIYRSFNYLQSGDFGQSLSCHFCIMLSVRLGYGIDRMMRQMHEHGLSPPRFEETAGGFRVTLLGASDALPEAEQALALEAYTHLELNPRQEKALLFLQRQRRITNRDYQALCTEVHSETLRRDLSDLVRKDVLLRIGDKRATYYILKKPVT